MSGRDDWSEPDWSQLPAECLLHIFSFLSLRDRCHAALTCSTFYHVSLTPSLWESIKFCFYTPPQAKYTSLAERVASHLQQVWIDIDQGHDYNRHSALKVIELIRRVNTRGISAFKMTFAGENPCFYSGREFMDALLALFGGRQDEGTLSVSNPSCCEGPAVDADVVEDSVIRCGRPVEVGGGVFLSHLDLGEMSVALDDHFMDVLSENNPRLQSVNIQTYPTYICRVTPEALARFINRCRHLQSLNVYKSSLNDQVIKLFLEPDRKPLLKLSLRHTSEDNSSEMAIPSETWKLLTQSLTSLRVAMAFDETSTCDYIIDVHLNPNMPVSSITMETTSFIFYDMAETIVNNYRTTLVELVLMTSIKPRAMTLGRALRHVAGACGRLSRLVVYSILDQEVVEGIRQLRPNLDHHQSFLKHETWLIDTDIQVKHTQVWAN